VLALAVVWLAALLSGAGEDASRVPPRSAPPAGDPETIMLNFERTGIRTLLLYLAEVTGQTIIPAPEMREDVTLQTPQPVSTGEAVRLLYALLETNGYRAVQDGICLRIVRVEQPDSTAHEAGSAASADPGERVVLNMDDVDLRAVAATLAELTGITVMPPPGLQGRVTVINPQPVTKTEAVRILYAVLETHGYSVVHYGSYAKIVRADQAAGKPIRMSAPPAPPTTAKEQ